MTPVEFLIENREAVLNAYEGSPVEAWRKLVELVQVDKAMTENTFRKILKPFAETCRFFDNRLSNEAKQDDGLNARLNEMVALNNQLNKTIAGLKNQIQELKDRLYAELNKEQAKYRLNVSDSELIYKTNEPDNRKPNRLSIAGWTVAKSGRYYRAFKKIKGRVHGVHLGLSLDNAEQKIKNKEQAMSG